MFILFPFVRFLGNEISEICDEALIVRTDSKIVPTVKFFKDRALQKLLCEVMILKTRSASLVQVASFSKCSFKSNIRLSVESNPRLHWFYSTSLCYWSRKLLSLRCRTKRNHNLVNCVFPCFRQIGWFYFDFSLASDGIFPFF